MSQSMKIVNMAGGLGNQMFQYAFAMMLLGVIFTGRSAARIRELKLRLLGKRSEGRE